MADFTLVLVQSSGRLTVPIWSDPEMPGDPMRLNPRAHVPHRYLRYRIDRIETVTLELNAVVGGVQAPADGALGGRLFSWSFSFWPVAAPIPAITSPVSSKTSRMTCSISGVYPGHYRINAARPGSGTVLIPFDIEAGA